MKLGSLFGSLFSRRTRAGNAAFVAPEPDPAVSLSLLEEARALAAQHHFDQARRVCEKIMERDPENEKAWMLLSHIHKEEGNLPAAKAALDKLIGLHPDLAEAYFFRANVLKSRRLFKAAIDDYARAVEINPAMIAAHINQGTVHYLLGEFGKALACARHALQLDPDSAVARLNQGLMLRELGETGAAEDALRSALELHPDHHETRCSLSMVLIDQGLFDEAERHLGTMLAADPSHVEARWLLSTACLIRGRFREGWRDYDSRLHRHDAWKRPYEFPEWDGHALQAGALLICAEQGLGDDILFASCIPDVLKRVVHCVIECEPRLVNLFRRSFPAATIHGSKHEAEPAWLAGGPRVVAQIAAGSLPRLLRNEAPDFPDHRGYLAADPVKVRQWRERLAQLGPGLKIGIAWTGGAVKTRRRMRSLALSGLLPLLELPGVQFVNLQYVDSAGEIAGMHAAHRVAVRHWPEAIEDYDETAALVTALDLVLSVCTSVVHLSGALGARVWVMVPASPEWRYLRQGERLPWYPSARLFRQQQAGDWRPVVDAVERELSQLARA